MSLSPAPLKALMVDPALFTAPYDEALTAGLNAAGVETTWVTRPLRAGEPDPPGLPTRRELYYLGDATASVKRGGVQAKLRKGASHVAGARRLLEHVHATRPDVVHLQWAVVPLVDRFLIRSLRRLTPVVFTVHDLTPFNASASSRLQTLGFEGVLEAASALVVHTRPAQEALIASGIPPNRVALIPHGPLRLGDARPSPPLPWSPTRRWRVVLFGKLQPYKGVDILVEALGRLAPSVRVQLEVIVAGEPLMDMEPLKLRIEQLGLQSVVELRLGRLSDADAHRLLDSADAFAFPYREIEASGVLYLVAGYGRWIVASDLGAFRDVVQSGANGQRVASGDIEALAGAIQISVGRTPEAAPGQGLTSWREIGRSTRRLYEQLAIAGRR